MITAEEPPLQRINAKRLEKYIDNRMDKDYPPEEYHQEEEGLEGAGELVDALFMPGINSTVKVVCYHYLLMRFLPQFSNIGEI